jgi:hypothetical protein
MSEEPQITNMPDLDKLINDFNTHDPETDEFANTVSSLAVLSRDQEAVRNKLASRDMLEHLLWVLSTRDKIVSKEEYFATILRCIGNACVSNPEACETVSEYTFSWCKDFLKGIPCQWIDVGEYWSAESAIYEAIAPAPFPMPSVSTRDLAIKVLYNVCSQFEGAQRQCYDDDIHTLVIEAMFDNQHFGSELSSEMLTLTVDLLLGITAHHKELPSLPYETERTRGLPVHEALKVDAFYWLIKAPLVYVDKLDVDDWASLLEVCLVFLRDPRSHCDLISWELFHVVWYILENNEAKTQIVGISDEDRKLLVALSTSLTWVLSDVAATPAFASAYATSTGNVLALAAGHQDVPVLQQLIEDLTNLLSTGEAHTHNAQGDRDTSLLGDESLRLTTAACQVIGNLLHGLASTKGTFPAVVQAPQLHERLFALMAESNNADFLHSATGLLIQLSRPSVAARKELASDSNALVAIKRLGQHTMQDLNQDALLLMRALGKDAPATQEMFKELAGEVMATVAETQKAAASAQAEQPLLENKS